eukprot:4160045-Karenia_brevis.AAC.1
MHDIFVSIMSTREFTHKGLRASYRQEFGRLCAWAAQYNCLEAWAYMVEPVGRGVADTVVMKRAR